MTIHKQKSSTQPRSNTIQTRSSRPNLNTPAGTQGETTEKTLPPPPQAKEDLELPFRSVNSCFSYLTRVPKRVRKHFQVELIEQRRRTLRSATMATSSHDSIVKEAAQIEGESSKIGDCGDATMGESALNEKLEGVEKGEMPKEGAVNNEIKETKGEEKGEQPIEGANPSEIEIEKGEQPLEETNPSEIEKEGGEVEEYDSAKEDFVVEEVKQEHSIDLNRDPKSASLKAMGEEEVCDEEGDLEGNTSARTTPPKAADPKGGPVTDPSAEEPDEDMPLSHWQIRNINKEKSISGAGVTIFPGQESTPLKRLVKAS